MLVEIRKMGKVERAAVTSLDVAATFRGIGMQRRVQ